jgi:RecA-family ATPase
VRALGPFWTRGFGLDDADAVAAEIGKDWTDEYRAEVEQQTEERKQRAAERVQRLKAAVGALPFPEPVGLGEFMATAWPPIEFLIEDYVPLKENTLFTGEGGVGKTTVAIDMGVCVAAGIPFLGKLAVKQRPVLLVLGEDQEGATHKRIAASLAYHGLTERARSLPLRVWTVQGHDFTLASFDDLGTAKELPFLEKLSDRMAETPGCFVVLDSLADIALLDEAGRLGPNNLFKKVLGGLIKLHDATIMTLGHPSKASKLDGSMFSGSTAFRAAVRGMMFLEWEDDKNRDTRRRLKRNKGNYAADDIGRGLPLVYSSGLFKPMSDPEVKASADASENAQRAAVLAEVGRLLDQGERVTKEVGRGNAVSLRDVVATINRAEGAGFVSVAEAKRFMREATGFAYREGYGKTKASYVRL